MSGNVVELCVKCVRPARWKVCDTAGEGARVACDEHLPRVASRCVRRFDGPAVVSPMFLAGHVDDLAPLLLLGADVYGLVADPTASLAAEAMTPATRETVVAALRRPSGAESRGVRVIRPDERPDDPADAIPFPDSWERHEGPDE